MKSKISGIVDQARQSVTYTWENIEVEIGSKRILDKGNFCLNLKAFA